MPLVAKSSIDGSVMVEEITIGSEAYDIPPWLTKAEFIAGLESHNDDNALSSLTSCKIFKWAPDNSPIFDLTFNIPFGAVRELAYNFFTPIPQYQGGEIFITINDDSVTVNMQASEYTDFNDVQIAILPLGFQSVPYNGNSKLASEFYEDLQADLPNMAESAVGWAGRYEEFTTKAGENYFLLLNVHED